MKKILHDRKVFVLIYAIYLLVIFKRHLPMTYISDDEIFFNISNSKTLLQIFELYYFSESGKFVSDVFPPLFFRMPMMVWKVFDTFVYLAIAILMNHYIFKTKNALNIAMTCFMILLFPFFYLASSGYIMTTANYIYPILALLIAMLPLKRIMDGQQEKQSIPSTILTIVCMLYGCTNDTYGIATILFLSGLLLYAIIFKKDVWKKAILKNLVFAVLIYAFFFFAPGHMFRLTNGRGEMEYWFPEYAAWTLFHKIYYGFSSTVANLFFNKIRVLFILFIMLLVLSIYKKNTRLSITYGISLLFLFISNTVLHNTFVVYFEKTYGMPTIGLFSENPIFILSILISIMYILLAVYGVFTLVENKYNAYVMFLLLSVGFITRWIMGFSATIYASSFRTFTALLFSIIAVNLMLFKEILDCENEKKMFKFLH